MDKDSPYFVFVRAQMIIMGKQVKSWLDDLKKEREKDNPIDKRKLCNRVETAKIVSVTEVLKDKGKLPAAYKYPKHLLSPALSPKNKITISFSKPKNEVEKARAYFDVETANDAGSLAFDYFYENAIK